MTLPLTDVHKKILMSKKTKIGAHTRMHVHMCTHTCTRTHAHRGTDHRQSAYQENKYQLRLKGKQ